jgi:response regulator of citrate/malate metabolism
MPATRLSPGRPPSTDDLRERLEHYQRTYVSLTSTTQETDQAEVDRVFGMSRAEAPLPKGLSAETLRLVAEKLREADVDLSAAEMAAALGLSRVSARRYLEHLADTGKADVKLRYGEVGRPERRYAWR